MELFQPQKRLKMIRFMSNVKSRQLSTFSKHGASAGIFLDAWVSCYICVCFGDFRSSCPALWTDVNSWFWVAAENQEFLEFRKPSPTPSPHFSVRPPTQTSLSRFSVKPHSHIQTRAKFLHPLKWTLYIQHNPQCSRHAMYWINISMKGRIRLFISCGETVSVFIYSFDLTEKWIEGDVDCIFHEMLEALGGWEWG